MSLFRCVLGWDQDSLSVAELRGGRAGPIAAARTGRGRYFVRYTSSDRDWAFWIGWELLKLGHEAQMNGWRNITAASQKCAKLLTMNYQHIITIDPGKRGGRPCIRHMRIAVADVLGWLAAGQTHTQILGDFPELTEDDIRACLAYAADRERRLITASI
jgi:uncharacterized protein (DUF433 family)